VFTAETPSTPSSDYSLTLRSLRLGGELRAHGLYKFLLKKFSTRVS
jgi:hypothetical protein